MWFKIDKGLRSTSHDHYRDCICTRVNIETCTHNLNSIQYFFEFGIRSQIGQPVFIVEIGSRIKPQASLGSTIHCNHWIWGKMDLHRRITDKRFSQDHSTQTRDSKGYNLKRIQLRSQLLIAWREDGVRLGQSRKIESNTLRQTMVTRTGYKGIKVLISSTLHVIFSNEGGPSNVLHTLCKH